MASFIWAPVNELEEKRPALLENLFLLLGLGLARTEIVGIHRYFFLCCLHDSRTKGSRVHSCFFELQEKYFSLELANLILSQETENHLQGKFQFVAF